ncbi:MAG: tetratricopeptide repeat protein, partial [Rhodothermales bacterium]
DIQRYLDRRPIQARPQTLRYRSAKFVRRYHRTAIAALIGFLVLIGGIFTTAREANKKEQARQTQTATVGFIENILEKVDPDKKEGYSFTTKELIVAGLSELQHLGTQPQVHADIMNDFGKIALNARLFDLADSLHHQALLIQQNIPGNNNSDLSVTYTRIATVLADKKDYQNATLQFLEALTLDSQNHIARNNLGELLYNQGKFKEAAEQYSLAYQIAPNEVRYLRNIGASFFNLSEWEKSKQAYLKSIEIEPYYNAFASLATIFYTIDKDYLSAVNFYENALELNDQDYDMWGYLASALFAADPESPKAMEANQKAITLAEEHLEKLDPNDPYVHVVLAGYYGRAGNFAKVQYHLDKTFESPNIDDLAFDIGYAYELMGERSKALDYVEQAVDEGSLDIYILNEPAFESLRQSSYFKENLASKLSTI